jgi:ABC-type glycerol-3-phosphate transport system substrate-binding protein
MSRRTVALLVGSAVAAAMLTYLVVQVVAQQLSTTIKIALVIVVAFVALGLAWWGAGSTSEDAQEKNSVSIGSKIKAESDVDVEGIKVAGEPKGQIEVGSEISAGGSVRVKGVDVNSGRNDNE